MIVNLTINGRPYAANVASSESLLRVLRDDLALKGTKDACEQGECGSCSVILDGELVCSCLIMALDCQGSTVTTVEGLADEEQLHPVQRALLDHHGVQCGFCTPGFVVAASHLLERNPNPDAVELREALAGNLCRCTGYGAIARALAALTQEGD